MNLHAGPLQLLATSLILISPFTKFALTLEPVARGAEQFLQRVSPLTFTMPVAALECWDLSGVLWLSSQLS